MGGQIGAKSYAAFAQATYSLTDSLKLTGGIRFTADEKSGTNENILFSPLEIDEVGFTEEALTGRAALDWSFSDTGLLFASYSRGYKSGGINQFVRVAADNLNAVFEPEFVDNFEVGLKSRFLENRLQLNISAFLADYQDLQFQIFTGLGNQAGNAGGATIQGIETEVQFAVDETWTLDGSFAYTDAEYDELIVNQATGEDLAGNSLPRTPEFTFNAGVTGDWDLWDGSNLRARASFSFTDEIFYEFVNGPESLADSYTNTDLRLFWTDKNDRFYVEGFVTNVFDTVQEGNILVGFGLSSGTGPNDVGNQFITFNPPRQYGATLGYKF